MFHNSHSLETVVAYIVEQTYVDGERLSEPLTRNRVAGATGYPRALELVRSYRKISGRQLLSWAVIRAEYADGCLSEPF